MDLESTIMGLAILLTCIMPIIIIKLRSVSKKRKFINLLHKLAQKNNTTIAHYDHWNRSAIGSNSNNTQLFTITEDNGEIKSQAFALSSFTKCNLINDNAGADFKEGNFKVSHGVHLELLGKNQQSEQITFYDIGKDGHLLTEELELATKWRKMINECITQRSGLYEEQLRSV